MLTAEGLCDSAPPRREVAAQKAKTVWERCKIKRGNTNSQEPNSEGFGKIRSGYTEQRKR